MDEPEIKSAMSDDVRLMLNIIYEMLKQPYTFERAWVETMFKMLELQTMPVMLVKPKKDNK